MLRCNKCNEVVSNDDAKFCEKCGEFLELTGKQIRFEGNISNNKLNDFKKILIESTNSISDVRVDSKWNYSVIISYLIDLTNVDSIFKHDEMNFIDIGYILNSLIGCSNELIVYEFLVKVNEFYEFYKNNNDKELKNVIIYTNLDKRLKSKVEFDKILDFFNLEVFNFEDFVFKENQDGYKGNFNSNGIMFKFSKKTRDVDLIKSEALNEIHALFGYFTYINKFNMTTHRYHINELSLNNQVCDFECNALIVTNNDNEILKITVQNETIIHSKKFHKSKINKIESVELIKDFNNPDKMKISSDIKYYFNLYYLASFESSLENSFIKFWSLSEKIIKDCYGDIKDTKLKKVMKNILKANNYPKYLIKRIDYLHKKRNELVHENVHGEISQYDQTLIKVISERLIEFLINFLDKINYKEDYSIILDYINQDDEKKMKIINLIKLTIND